MHFHGPRKTGIQPFLKLTFKQFSTWTPPPSSPPPISCEFYTSSPHCLEINLISGFKNAYVPNIEDKNKLWLKQITGSYSQAKLQTTIFFITTHWYNLHSVGKSTVLFLSLSWMLQFLKQTKCSRSVWICIRGCSAKREAEVIRSSCLLTRTSISKDGTAINCRWHACSKEPCTISTFSWHWWSKEVCCLSSQMEFTTRPCKECALNERSLEHPRFWQFGNLFSLETSAGIWIW